MRERVLKVATPDGMMPTFVTCPERGGPYPAVLLFMDALGIREELRDIARRLGTAGYYVVLANLFYRDGGPSFDPSRLASEGPDPRMTALNMALTHERVLSDTQAMLALVHADEHARAPVGTLGYCMGGRHALAAAGTFADEVAAMVSLHGGFQVTNRADSAHLLIEHVKAQCYLGFADGDPLSPPEHQRVIAQAMRQHDVRHELEVYPGAEHGFTFPERYCYHKPSAERAWERLHALFRCCLQLTDR